MAAEIRRAGLADVDTLVELARALHAEAPAYRDEPFEEPVLRRWLAERLQTNLLADDSAVFLAESGGRAVGALIGIIVPRWFNRQRIACELTLYVAPEHRGGRAFPLLVTAFKRWAKAQGAAKAMLGTSTGIHAERTVRAYERMGFTLDGYNSITTL